MQQVIDMMGNQRLSAGLTAIQNFTPPAPVAPGTQVDLDYTVANITTDQTLKIFGYVQNTGTTPPTQETGSYWETDNIPPGGTQDATYTKTVNDTYNGELVCGHFEGETPEIPWIIIAGAAAIGIVALIAYSRRKKT